MNNAPLIRCRCIVLWAVAIGFLPSWLAAESKPTPQHAGDAFQPINGSLVIVGGGGLPPAIIDRFIELGGGKETRLVVITTASVFAGEAEMDARMDYWRAMNLKSLTVLHTRSRDEANDPKFYRPITEATAVWFIGGNQTWLTDAYLGTRTETMLRELLNRGGVIGGTSAGAAVMSRVMIAGGKETPLLKSGFGFVPTMIVDQHFRKRNRQDRLTEAMQQHPGLIGMGIDELTALVISGSRAEVLGESDVTITLPAANGRPARTESFSPGKTVDLYALTRAAKSRKAAPQVAKPGVKSGTLLLVGDGDVPEEVEKEFLVAAGGNDAPIVVVCEAVPDGDEEHVICRRLRTAGASNVKLLPASTRADVESPDFLAELSAAKGIWLSHGPIRRLIDTYVDSPAQATLANLLDQGGVIAGSSAAAALQTATVFDQPSDDELAVISEAYECGFGFLPGVAIARREPENDPMTGLKARYPHLIGVELNDSTALLVRGSKMQVLGKNPVTILDRQPDDADDHPAFLSVNPGEAYDLAERTRLSVTSENAVER